MSQKYSGGLITANPTAPTTTSASGVWTLEQQFQNVGNWPKSSAVAVSRSVRLRSSASAYFNRTPASASNRKTWTWSGWVKRGKISTDTNLFAAFITNTNQTDLSFASSDDKLYFTDYQTTNKITCVTSAVFRDPSAWYHVVIAVDTTQATNSNGVKIYINGVQQTLTFTFYTQNQDTMINSTNVHQIGARYSSSPYYQDGYLTEINFIDGQALDQSYFGFTDSTGIWQPSSYTGQYGTNGFYLNFSDNSGVTATTIGKDYSGNGNNWTPNNISVTAGTTYDSMLDVPVNYADGGNGRGNYCVFNPLQLTGTPTFTGAVSKTFADGNLGITWGTGSYCAVLSTFAIPTSGKWYWEITSTTSTVAGAGIVASASEYSSASEVGIRVDYSNIYVNGTSVQSGLAGYTTNDILGIAWDAGANTMQFYKNGVAYGSAQSFTPISGVNYYASVMSRSSSFACTAIINFGQRPFTYTPPTGFVALNTQNLPTPTISNGANYMAATTYTGTGATKTISNDVNGVSFQPDLVWTKSRNNVTDHFLLDSVRGGSAVLFSDLTNAEITGTNYISGFLSGGFSTNSASNGINASGYTYAAWQWKAGGTSSSNTNGSITSTVSVGATQGFSVVTFTGTGSAATVGHGLGVAPSFIIAKRRGGISNWLAGTTALGWTKTLNLDLTDAAATTITAWNNTAPTSSVFSIGTFFVASTYVAYCFAEVAGYSKFGSYTGNGSADGPFVYCGFRPRWVMVKRTDTTSNWIIKDTGRSTYNTALETLYPNLSNAEGSGDDMDILSNGFKMKLAASTNLNASAGTYIFAAFAENPFKTSRAR